MPVFWALGAKNEKQHHPTKLCLILTDYPFSGLECMHLKEKTQFGSLGQSLFWETAKNDRWPPGETPLGPRHALEPLNVSNVKIAK